MENKTLFFGLLFIGLIAYARSDAMEDAINQALQALGNYMKCDTFPEALNQYGQNCFTCKADKWSFKGMDCIKNGGNGAESTRFNFVLFLATAVISLFLGGRF
jgi:hypothetical protein